MAEGGAERRLAAIVAVDVAGYSRLMGADEQGTLATLKAHRDAMTPLVRGHGGRLVGQAGDGLLLEFPSVIEAMTCAIEMQATMVLRNAGVADGKKMLFRVGINLGDVMIDGDDIFGDGINVAARIEALAEPGGICLSHTVHDQVRDRMAIELDDMGEIEVKNIARPVRVFRVLQDGEVAAKPTRGTAPWQKYAVVAVVALAVIVGGGVWWWQQQTDFAPADPNKMAFELPNKPSIAVLTFDNFSDDPKLNIVARGLTEDLTAALSKVPRLFVIARNSASVYKGKAVNVKQVAEELSVRYVLKGSLQKSGELFRITVQLIDAVSGNHVWADRFDRQPSDIFALQDEIVKRVMVELMAKLTHFDHVRAMSRDTNNLKSWLLRTEAIAEYFKFTREGNNRARELYLAALEADPKSAWPLAGVAQTHWYDARRRWSTDREESIRLGIELAKRAIKKAPNMEQGYMALGLLYFARGDIEKGIAQRRKAVEIAPNSFYTIAGLAGRLLYNSQAKEAVALYERAIRLSPNPPFWLPFLYGRALHLVGRKEEAVIWIRKAISSKPKRHTFHTALAAVYADLDRMNEAKSAAEEVLRLKPGFSIKKYQKTFHFQDPKHNEWIKGLLVRAGLPE